MLVMLIMLAAALAVSSIGFKKYVWFISIGYGFSVTAIAVACVIIYARTMTLAEILTAVLLALYGARLGGYLMLRELKAKSYNEKMKKEIKSGKGMNIGVKCAIWVTAALLYVCQTSPLVFRAMNHSGTDVVFIVGSSVSAFGLIIETIADFQKSSAKKKNPKRFVDTGLYRIVRCPNYFGEVLIWTGVFVGGTTACCTVWQWIIAVLGYLGIVYVMFSGARRLEERQNRTYGDDPKYQKYYKKTPIMIPLVPLYSVVRHKWLVG